MKNIKKTFTLILVFCLLLSCLSLFASADSSIGNISTEQMIIPPTAEQAAAAVASSSYSSAPGHIIPFVYDGTDSIIWSDIDVCDCEIGRLYTYNTNTGILSQISNSTIIAYTLTKEDLFYVTSENTIYHTDFTGSFHTELYQASQGKITNLDYYDGFLNFIEGSLLVNIVNISTLSAETVFSHNNIASVFFFDNDKFIWRDHYGNPTYYNTTTHTSVTLSNEQEVNSIVGPYITPILSEEEQAELMANNTSFNNITFPLSEYPANPANYTGYTTYPPASSRFTGRYAGTNQCDGFANYAFDKYYHITNTSDDPSFVSQDTHSYETVSPATCSGVLGNSDENGVTRITRIATSVNTGAFIRFGKIRDNGYCLEQHSGVIVSADSNGFWLYECNNDDACGVFYTYYTYAQISGKYHCVKYYVDHDLGSTKTYYSSTRHKRSCNNCNGYILSTHTATAQYNLFNAETHRMSFSCCSGQSSLSSHTGTKKHIIYSHTHHSIEYTCCTAVHGTVQEEHVYSGNYPECLKCGYSPELGYLKTEDPIDTE